MINSILTRFSSLKISLMVTALVSGSLLAGNAAHAVSSKECHQQFTAAKKAGNVKGQSFKEYKAANCKDNDAVKNSSKKEEAKKSEVSKETNVKKDSSDKKATTKEVASSSVASDAVFPNAVDAKYAKEKEGAARMHTCLDQYHANKASNKNGNLKWIQKGGGYYSECIKHLKAGSAQ